MRVQVIANCQARPVSALIAQILPKVSVLDPIILHLAKESDRDTHLSRIDSADIVLTQLTSDDFRPAHLSTSALKDRFSDRVIVWPNIFYSGQQPYLRYFTHPELGRLFGPMEALHDLRIYRSWKRHGRADPSALAQTDPDEIAAVRKISLDTLMEREKLCDVRISDYIEDHQDSAKLFFTFNHPTRLVLSEMVHRILMCLGHGSDITTATGPEFLARYQVPSTSTGPTDGFQGDAFELERSGGARRIPGPPVQYTAGMLCDAYTEVYNSHDVFQSAEDIRLTPNLPV